MTMTPRLVTYEGRTQNVSEWAREKDMRIHTLLQRFNNGWTTERALTTPVGRMRRKPRLPSEPVTSNGITAEQHRHHRIVLRRLKQALQRYVLSCAEIAEAKSRRGVVKQPSKVAKDRSLSVTQDIS